MLNKTRLVLLVAILSAAAGAVVFRTPSVLFLLATLVAAPLLAGGIGKWMSRGLRVSRQMPLVGTVGDEVRARLTVRNSGTVPALLVHACGRGADENPRRASWPGKKAHSDNVARAQSEAPAFFEVVGEDELMVPILMPGASFSGEIVWKLRRRGQIPWPGARAGTIDPINLSDPLLARSAPAELLILPRPLGLRRLSLGGGSPASQTLQRVTVSADAAEVHGVRPYQPGEGGRRIHWRATARTGELHVIEWEEEIASDLTMLLDVEARLIAGRAGNDTLEHAITVAASVAAFLVESGQRVRIFWWADEAGTTHPRLMRVEARHQGGLTQVLTALAKIVPACSEGATLAALSARAQREADDESVLLVASDEAAWSAALAPWQRGRTRPQAHGLAFEAASFQEAERQAFVWRAGAAVTATMQRVDVSKAPHRPKLPGGVRRVQRDSSLTDVLEREF